GYGVAGQMQSRYVDDFRRARELPGGIVIGRSIDNDIAGRGHPADMRIVDVELDLAHGHVAGKVEVNGRINNFPTDVLACPRVVADLVPRQRRDNAVGELAEAAAQVRTVGGAV